MNRERLLKLADILEKTPHFTKPTTPGKDNVLELLPTVKGFNMAQFIAHRECGTAGCIAGLTVFHFGEKGILDNPPDPTSILDDREGVFVTARALLDLSYHEAKALFYADGRTTPLETITPREAATACRQLAVSGSSYRLWK